MSYYPVSASGSKYFSFCYHNIFFSLSSLRFFQTERKSLNRKYIFSFLSCEKLFLFYFFFRCLFPFHFKFDRSNVKKKFPHFILLLCVCMCVYMFESAFFFVNTSAHFFLFLYFYSFGVYPWCGGDCGLVLVPKKKKMDCKHIIK